MKSKGESCALRHQHKHSLSHRNKPQKMEEVIVPEPEPEPNPTLIQFTPGSAVEVKINEGGFLESWFNATVLRTFDSDTYLVQYRDLVPDGKKQQKPLTETVSVFRLRPQPPPENHNDGEFDYLHEIVDAWFNHGWRVGVVFEDLKNGKFMVIFRELELKALFSREELRLHRVWANQDWIARNTDDRISELPDNVLHHIINLLGTSCAVRTCVLSKRWSNLYKCLTSLTFSEGSRETFQLFVPWVMSQRDESCSLNNLDIKSQMYAFDADNVADIIKYAVTHNIHHLKVDVLTRMGIMAYSELLTQIFRCRSLESVELNIRVEKHVCMLLPPRSLCMPTLKSINISYVQFSSIDYGCADPFSNSHVLETLVLKYCSLHGHKPVLRISNATLSSLTIFEGGAHRIELSTPNVSFVTFKGSSSHQIFSTCNLSSLKEVNIFIYEDDKSWYGKSSVIIGWLQVFANAKIVTLSLRAFRTILRGLSNSSSMMPQPPCFARLESLKVKRQLFTSISDEEVSRVVEYLLQNTPRANVEIITDA